MPRWFSFETCLDGRSFILVDEIQKRLVDLSRVGGIQKMGTPFDRHQACIWRVCKELDFFRGIGHGEYGILGSLQLIRYARGEGVG